MMLSLVLLVLVSVHGIHSCTDSPPAWPNVYSTRAVLYIPYTELEEPFLAYYDGTSGSSRIDYYGGTVKTYQLTNYGQFGSNLKIAPMTTEQVTNVETCFAANGTKEDKVVPQSVLPDLTGFKCSGQEMINGLQCDKWVNEVVQEEKISKYALYIRYEKIAGGGSRVIPVRYEMKGYNSLLGSHYDHYYINYNMFSYDAVPSDVFDVSDLKCGDFPGPGITHKVSANPIREFVKNDDSHIEADFNEFTKKHEKSYDNHIEVMRRKNIFRQNHRYINSMNRKGLGFQLAINHLADKTDEERAILRGYRPSGGYNGGSSFPYTEKFLQKVQLPDSLDWRLYGAVTQVKDQSVCGSCWSFGTTGTVEGAYFVKTGKLVRLSSQALMDCSWGYGNNACDGGEDFRSYQWMMKHGGIPLEDEYGPYLGQDGLCHVDSVKVVAPITGYVNVTTWNENALKLALFKHGPISVSIDASLKSFSFYSNGVFYDPKCKNKSDELDHSVLAVGYGSLNGKKYWLIKNSWSNYWGDDGYILIAMKKNNCGVMTAPTYVTM